MNQKVIKTNHVYLGDCAVLLTNASNFPDKSVDFIITSPPYGNRRKNNYTSIHPDKFVDWFEPISKELFRILKNNGSFVLNIKESVIRGQRHTYVLELILMMKLQGWRWIEEYCWYKKNSFPGKWPNRFRDGWERCLHFSKSSKFKMYQNNVKVPIGDWKKKRFSSLSQKDFSRQISSTGSGFGRNVSNWLGKRKVYPHNVLDFEVEHYYELNNVIHAATVNKNSNHCAAFPIELPYWFIKLFTRNGNIVFDPFLGIGTSAIASILLNRKYIGIERKPEFVNEAKKNINELLKIRK